MRERKRRPPSEQFETAIAWLRVNDGGGGEWMACYAVAQWLQDIEDDRFVRQEARKAGVTPARLRRALEDREP